ncbi:hypothetical protein [Arenibacter lacus]|uniref:hypothetical protein n=1 Tax=Arenibacter lacus TaxID=2608629 RepID=UPI00123C8B49|nr:hypothetical protein [Arenibacter lacus]
MKEKFKDIPEESGTKILVSFEVSVDKYDAVYQKWYWDGINAESLIFFNEDVAELSEEEIKNQVSENTALLKEGSQMTFKKGEKYTFVNFNFKTS